MDGRATIPNLSGRSVTRPRHGQREPEGAALALDALNADLAAHQLHELLARSRARGRCRRTGAWWSRPPGRRTRRSRRARPASMPIPVSLTSKRIAVARPPSIARSPARDLALARELDRVGHQVRQHLAHARAIAATRPRGSSASIHDDSSSPLRRARGATSRAHVLDQRREVERRRRRARACPASIFEKSRISSISASRVVARGPHRVGVLALLGGPARCRAGAPSSPITPFSGVRISWLMFATNSDLSARASSALSWARFSRSWSA